ncbi:MAG: T9SS type A sorting domain-containing protein [Chitinophagaceae bacterium]|nr:T9SS type A sorting domain-containing protein [Chitinophagaceae bacterium]
MLPLELDGLVAEDNGTQLRVRLQGPCSTVFSDAITLTVYELPAPVITTADNICLDQRGVQLAAAPAGGTFEGRGVTGTTWNLEALPVGQHRIDYTYTDNNGCTSKTSKLINVDVCATEKVVMSLETYPNPTSGKVTLKAFVTEGTNWSVNVTNFNGTLVSTKRVPLREGWNTFQVDLTGQPGGVYIISLVQDGKRRTEVKFSSSNYLIKKSPRYRGDFFMCCDRLA